MSSIKKHQCPSCGGTLSVDNERQMYRCKFCGSTYDYEYFREEHPETLLFYLNSKLIWLCEVLLHKFYDWRNEGLERLGEWSRPHGWDLRPVFCGSEGLTLSATHRATDSPSLCFRVFLLRWFWVTHLVLSPNVLFIDVYVCIALLHLHLTLRMKIY